ncbi:uncharacterized protein LOC144010741 isoform X2 [Festucalex cinctus]
MKSKVPSLPRATHSFQAASFTLRSPPGGARVQSRRRRRRLAFQRDCLQELVWNWKQVRGGFVERSAATWRTVWRFLFQVDGSRSGKAKTCGGRLPRRILRRLTGPEQFPHKCGGGGA